MTQKQKWLSYVAELREKHDLDIQKLKDENSQLREALKTCIDELMYESTTGHLWMWGKSNTEVPERLLEIRKLFYHENT